MRIILNGTPLEIPEGLTIERLIDHLQLPPHTLLIELNENALHKSEWADSALHPDDRVEFIRVAAGG